MEQRITYHFVWGPMRSKPCLTGETARRLRELIREKAEALGVTVDHLHILPDRVYVAVAAPPILSPHRIICQFKAHSSHCLRHEFQEMTKIPTVWTRAYLRQALLTDIATGFVTSTLALGVRASRTASLARETVVGTLARLVGEIEEAGRLSLATTHAGDRATRRGLSATAPNGRADT